jgi:hypothetical protein
MPRPPKISPTDLKRKSVTHKSRTTRLRKAPITTSIFTTEQKPPPQLGDITPPQIAGIVYPIPTVYSQLLEMDTSAPIARSHIYQQLSRLTPYLVSRLVYESVNPDSRASDRIHAAEVLLNKVMPNLSAEQLEINPGELQSLVIVRSGGGAVASVATTPDVPPDDQPSKE